METAEVECMYDECGWAGDRAGTFVQVIRKAGPGESFVLEAFDPGVVYCPECGTRITESEGDQQ